MYKIALVLLAATADGCSQTSYPDTPPPSVACTEEAKQCPDGSFVGRSGPHCEFICPLTTPN